MRAKQKLIHQLKIQKSAKNLTTDQRIIHQETIDFLESHSCIKKNSWFGKAILSYLAKEIIRNLLHDDP